MQILLRKMGEKKEELLSVMSRNAEQKKRLEWLDFGKAMGILVVLAVHAGCSLGALTYYGGMFYMPIFFFAAGYTFRRKGRGELWRFSLEKGKASSDPLLWN